MDVSLEVLGVMHKSRVWSVADVPDLDQLVEKLVEHTWTGCQGFRWRGLLWLNDSTGADGAQEYAVVREEDLAQVESLTVSWMTRDELRKEALRIQAGEPAGAPPGPVATVASLGALRTALAAAGPAEPGPNGVARRQLEAPEQHGRCALCA